MANRICMKRAPGLDQGRMVALCKTLAQTLGSSSKKVSFNGKKRNVYGRDPNGPYYVLDEFHGHFEVLDARACHLGIQEIFMEFEPVPDPRKKGQLTAKDPKAVLGPFTKQTSHRYTWTK
jgi:hypothetical protein